MQTVHDVLIVGGGPGGLQAALTLARARRRVLLCDAGPRRNAAAKAVHNLLTRDGIPPEELRSVARAQLAAYPNVQIEDLPVLALGGARGAFQATLPTGVVTARRVLLATGMVDQPLPLEGSQALWGRSIFQCPYCHGWEERDRRWGFLVSPTNAAHLLPFALMLRAWSPDVTVFTQGVVTLAEPALAALLAAGLRVETAPIRRLAGVPLERVELEDGVVVPCEVLFAHPPQRQVQLVQDLGLALDDDGFVQVDPMRRETSVPGIYASGDLTTRMQAAVAAAAAGMQAAAALNGELSMALALGGG